MSYLLDADWIIQAAAGQPIAAQMLRRLSPHRVSVCWFTVAEVYEGAFNSVNPSARIALFRHFLSPFRFLSMNDGIAEQFAEIRAFLRRRGELISEFDVMIGATALHYDLTVLTFNLRHFQRIPDLKLFPPT
ncbi:MAG: type II toxin-antitoxin system VapC family toxin [Thermomicrobiales bacterium]